jgi:hypothetical protein
MKKAEVYISGVTIRVNTHGLINVPSEKSQKTFFDSVWSMNIKGWDIQSSNVAHFVVFDFTFDVKEEDIGSIELVRKEIEKLTYKLKPIQ